MIRSTLLTAAAAVAIAGSANAASVTIDSFDTTNFQVLGAPTLGTPAQNPATTSGATADAIGGIRTLTNERTDPAGTANAFGRQVSTVISGGIAAVSLGASTEGTALISWDAGGADLVDGTNDRITLDVISADLSVNFTLSIGGVSVTESVGSSGPGTLAFNFSDFAGVDLTNVSTISLLVSGQTSFDTEFDLIQAVGEVPLPAAGLLAIAGLGALGATRARRKS